MFIYQRVILEFQTTSDFTKEKNITQQVQVAFEMDRSSALGSPESSGFNPPPRIYS
jgi:hypothetical protein